MDNNIKNTERFSSKVADYVAFRPSYPEGLFTVLSKKYPALNEPGAVIADVGSGTGILTVQLLNAFPHATVYAVEPNEAMRKAAEEFVPKTLGTSERFVSTNGTAEDTTLSNGVADLMIAGTAAHWFDTEGTKKEWQRVLKSGGGAAFAWNTRMSGEIWGVAARTEQSEVMLKYDELVKDTKGLAQAHADAREKMKKDVIIFFGSPKNFERQAIDNPQQMTLEQVIGRFLSSSWAPARGSAESERIEKELSEAFEKSKDDNGMIEYWQSTVLILGTF